jgi:hypothetical protein
MWAISGSESRSARRQRWDGTLPPKIFGIGFHKTGTKSLKAALEELGYRVTGPNYVRDPRIGARALDLVLPLVSLFDAFQDNPWPLLYRPLDERFPGSRFILTSRPTETWLESVVRHFGAETTPMREWIYGAGAPLGNEDRYVEVYKRHNEEVLAYFKGREHDFLHLRVTEGEGWQELCRFLGKPSPGSPFPHQNAAEARA